MDDITFEPPSNVDGWLNTGTVAGPVGVVFLDVSAPWSGVYRFRWLPEWRLGAPFVLAYSRYEFAPCARPIWWLCPWPR